MKISAQQVQAIVSSPSKGVKVLLLATGLVGGQMLTAPPIFWVSLGITLPWAVAYTVVQVRRQRTKDKALDLAKAKTVRGDPINVTDAEFNVQTGCVALQLLPSLQPGPSCSISRT